MKLYIHVRIVFAAPSFEILEYQLVQKFAKIGMLTCRIFAEPATFSVANLHTYIYIYIYIYTIV